MSYWGTGPIDNDYAFDSIRAYIYLIKERMFQDAKNVIEKSYPEQAVVASIQCLRSLAGPFREPVKLQFGRKDFQKAKDAFESWYSAVEEKLPGKYRDSIRTTAELEFQLFESEVLTSR